MDKISVVIPVGPYDANQRWLPEAIASVKTQSLQADEILIIDDQAHLDYGQFGKNITMWKTPWLSGVAHSFNFGVALAANDLVFLMGSDDTLETNCLEKCLREWENNQRSDAYYYTGIRYMDNNELQTAPCGYALVTKGLWKKTGGFPVESAAGAPDAAFISILMVHNHKMLVGVAGGAPLVNYRRHNESDTAGRAPWQSVILETRNILTNAWKAPNWPR